MSKITLDVTEKNVETVMTILENLKSGLISDISVDNKKVKPKTVYTPPKNKVIKENSPVAGKYISPAAYKKRLQGK